MQNIKLIIGANYGDEGKGLAADYFGARAAGKFNTINVLTNGGPQRGHTVELADGRRHVFKHFGAASFRGAASYFDEQFMVNPMEFMREYSALSAVHEAPEAYINPRCRFSTPWDMLTNQLFSEKNGLHNSCGFGIWETVLRYRKGYGISLGAFAKMSREDRILYLRGLRDGYFAERIRGLNAADCFFRDELLCHFEQDCESMLLLCPLREDDYLRHYQTVLFENAQGLLLDGNSLEGQEFTTPSTTGSARVTESVERIFRGADVEICYVTRSYLTRHGDGPMEDEITERQLASVFPDIRPDATNTQNRFQGNLRYGMMDVNLLAERIRKDFDRGSRGTANRYRSSVMITHLNEYAGIDTGSLAQRFETLYLSDGKTGGDTHILKRTGAQHAVRTAISAGI